MSLLTPEEIAQLRANSIAAETQRHLEGFDPVPVVKFFTPSGGCTWLLTEIDADNDRMFGLCDLGFGEPELGYVLLSEIESLGPAVEKDLYVKLDKPLSHYSDQARRDGQIFT